MKAAGKEPAESDKEMEMQDNRWCDSCGSDRGTKKVSWYLWDGNETSLCNKCVTELRGADIGTFAKIID